MPGRPSCFALASLAAFVSFGAAACSRAPEPPKTPLAQSSIAAPDSSAPAPLPLAARTALDSGNAEFRAKRYETALAHYRAAAKALPADDATAYYGIYMAAKKLGNNKLADSAQAVVKKRSATTAPMLTDSALSAVHAAAGAKTP
jgi:hypothetical protein